MRMVKRPRYYCDHCNKGNGSAYAIMRHERTCTANPVRDCRMCRTSNTKAIENSLILTMPTPYHKWEERMEVLREMVNNCPCCILAAIRLSGVQKTDDLEPLIIGDHVLGFDFKGESLDYLANRNEKDYGYDYYM